MYKDEKEESTKRTKMDTVQGGLDKSWGNKKKMEERDFVPYAG